MSNLNYKINLYTSTTLLSDLPATRQNLNFLVFNATFSNIMATSFNGGGSQSTRREPQATGKLYHLRLRVECTLFCNLKCWVRTHAVLVIGLYELLDPTT